VLWTRPGGADVAIFVLAPSLLLLNQDPLILWGLGDRQRYFPPVAAISCYLFVNAGWQVASLAFWEPNSLIKEHMQVWLLRLGRQASLDPLTCAVLQRRCLRQRDGRLLRMRAV
jgi:hypothetical protein